MNNLLTEIQKMVKQQHRNHARQPRISQSRRGEVKANESLCNLDNGFPAETEPEDFIAKSGSSGSYSNIHEDDPQEDANYVDRNMYTEEEL